MGGLPGGAEEELALARIGIETESAVCVGLGAAPLIEAVEELRVDPRAIS